MSDSEISREAKRLKMDPPNFVNNQISQELLEFQQDLFKLVKKSHNVRSIEEAEQALQNVQMEWEESDLSKEFGQKLKDNYKFKEFHSNAFIKLAGDASAKLSRNIVVKAWKFMLKNFTFPYPIEEWYDFILNEEMDFSKHSWDCIEHLPQCDEDFIFYDNYDNKTTHLMDEFVEMIREKYNKPASKIERKDLGVESLSSSNSSNMLAYGSNSKVLGGIKEQTEFSSSWISDRNSKGDYVGLLNQGATCYLNSLIQTLFMTPEFRQGLYQFKPKDSEFPIPYELQKLFSKLQLSKKRAVSTSSLTKSFGWDRSDSFTQHDVQELCRVLFDALEPALEGTEQGSLINDLYQGTMNDYVQCLECKYKSVRPDNFLDISLDLHDVANLDEALRKFITPETLNGNSQYACEKCNKRVDALKGLSFIKFPYVLMVHLKRFDYDGLQDRRVKLDHYVSFPFSIDLDKYLDITVQKDSQKQLKEEDQSMEDIQDNLPLDVAKEIAVLKKQIAQLTKAIEDDQMDEDGNQMKLQDDWRSQRKGFRIRLEALEKMYPQSNKSKEPRIESPKPGDYELFSVLVHSGSALGGHYYAYIKSFEKNKWYNFNDSSVIQISEEEIKKTFGGSSTFEYSSTAYMLIYRKIDPILNCNKVPDDLVPHFEKKIKEKPKVNGNSVHAPSSIPSEYSGYQNKAGKRTQKSKNPDSIEDGYEADSNEDADSNMNAVDDDLIELYIYFKEETLLQEIKPDITLEQLLNNIIDYFQLAHIPRDNIRLREKFMFSQFGKGFDGLESKKLSEVGILDKSLLQVEVKESHERWKVYDPDQMEVRVVIFNHETKEMGQLKELTVSKKGSTLKNLKEAIQNSTSIPMEHQRLYRKYADELAEEISKLPDETLLGNIKIGIWQQSLEKITVYAEDTTTIPTGMDLFLIDKLNDGLKKSTITMQPKSAGDITKPSRPKEKVLTIQKKLKKVEE